jgi:hypothetical protein
MHAFYYPYFWCVFMQCYPATIVMMTYMIASSIHLKLETLMHFIKHNSIFDTTMKVLSMT